MQKKKKSYLFVNRHLGRRSPDTSSYTRYSEVTIKDNELHSRGTTHDNTLEKSKVLLAFMAHVC